MGRVSGRATASAASLFVLTGLVGGASDHVEAATMRAAIQKSSRGAGGPADKTRGRADDRLPLQPDRSATVGTGFFVSPEGHLITNAHVVEGCNAPKVTTGLATRVSARVLDRDALNDLALIKGDLKPAAPASLRAGVKIGEAIATFGYPLVGLLSTRGNFTMGNISAITGIGDDFEVLANYCAGATGKQRRTHARPSRKRGGCGCWQAGRRNRRGDQRRAAKTSTLRSRHQC